MLVGLLPEASWLVAMAEATAQQLAKLQPEVYSLQAQLQASAVAAKEAATKDPSLVSLVPKWAGTPKTATLIEFLEPVETAARIERWIGEDKVSIAALKLSDPARAFLMLIPNCTARK
jgi:hypothetical protein